jgi:hypothetical protein
MSWSRHLGREHRFQLVPGFNTLDHREPPPFYLGSRRWRVAREGRSGSLDPSYRGPPSEGHGQRQALDGPARFSSNRSSPGLLGAARAGPAYSAMPWKVKNVEPAGAAGSRSMPKSRGRKPKKPRAPTKGAPKQLIAHSAPPREPPIPAQTVQQERSISPQTVQQESSIPRQTLLQSILKRTMKSVKRAWVLPRLFGS